MAFIYTHCLCMYMYMAGYFLCVIHVGETNLDALMTTLITAVEVHNVQLEREIQEEVRESEGLGEREWRRLESVLCVTS